MLYIFTTKDVRNLDSFIHLFVTASRQNYYIILNYLFFISISFKMVPKKNSLVSPPQIKYYPCAIQDGEDDLESLADILSSQSTISKADFFGVIMALTKVFGESFSEGRIIRIDNLDLFQITLQGVPSESPEE